MDILMIEVLRLGACWCTEQALVACSSNRSDRVETAGWVVGQHSPLMDLTGSANGIVGWLQAAMPCRMAQDMPHGSVHTVEVEERYLRQPLESWCCVSSMMLTMARTSTWVEERVDWAASLGVSAQYESRE